MLYEVITDASALMMNRLTNQIGNEVTFPLRIRITSYNVCYTKLLRIQIYSLAAIASHAIPLSFT